LDAVDKAIWILPLLALLDVISTFYVESLGYSLQYYEQGFFASFFVRAGSIYLYLYAVIYLFITVGIACVLWYIKNKELKRSQMLDKLFFLVLIGFVFYVYLRLTAAFAVNFLLPTILSRGISLFWLIMIIYLSSAVSLGMYLQRAVVTWVKPNDDKKEK